MATNLQAAIKTNKAESATPDFSFVGEPLLRERHRIHAYPAMLHPLLVQRLIHIYGAEKECLFDPFCGSGTTLLTASLASISAFGYDINPLALTIARAKTTVYDFNLLRKEYQQLAKKIQKLKLGDVPHIKNIDYWYLPAVVDQLARIRESLKSLKLTYSDFFVAIFASVSRKFSLTRQGEFKRYRKASVIATKSATNVIERYLDLCLEMIDLYSSTAQPEAEVQTMLQNITDHPESSLTADLVITSPPYGDSKTTVAYGQYSSFGISWIEGLPNVLSRGNHVDAESLGRKKGLDGPRVKSKTLIEVTQKIREINPSRADDVTAFFAEYRKAIDNTIAMTKPKSTVCYVVGNRTVANQVIPLDLITSELLADHGLIIEGIYPRSITNKVMPLKNSPGNGRGKTGQTMTKEFIVVAHRTP